MPFVTFQSIKPIHLLIALTCTAISSAHASFSLSGKLASLEPGSKIQLLREDLDQRSKILAAETDLAPDQSFIFPTDIEPGLYTLSLPDERTVTIAAEFDEQISIEESPDHAGELLVRGSPSTDLLLSYHAFRKESLGRLVYPPRRALNKAASNGASQEEQSELARQEVDGYAAHLRELNDFVIEKITTKASVLYATSARWDGDYRRESLQRIVDTIAKKNPKLPIVLSMQERLRLFSKTAVGVTAANLSGTSLKGNTLSLADYRGKVVLVDFWASWCTPCRVENRHYVELLDSYSNDDFTIFAINLDSDQKRWGIASKRDGITWPQISDGLAWKSPYAEAYNVSALPMSFLLDKEGKIIARNLRGPELTKKLEALFEK